MLRIANTENGLVRGLPAADPRITSFHITHDWYSGVNDAENGIVAQKRRHIL